MEGGFLASKSLNVARDVADHPRASHCHQHGTIRVFSQKMFSAICEMLRLQL